MLALLSFIDHDIFPISHGMIRVNIDSLGLTILNISYLTKSFSSRDYLTMINISYIFKY
jgi:hypothetical protein